MKTTVCELPNDQDTLLDAWTVLCEHVRAQKSELVLLPEMPFYRWLAHEREVSLGEWENAIQAHLDWIKRFKDLEDVVVMSTRPEIVQGVRHNIGYVWDSTTGLVDGHTKYYLPDEVGFWEASWYSRGEKEFKPIQTRVGLTGFQICTELWFYQHAREYGKAGVQLLVCPRATPSSTAGKWLVGGQAAAVVSGAFCLSSNLSGVTLRGGDYAGLGWIIEPEGGEVMGTTTRDNPFLTLDLDISKADAAKVSYPRYVRE